MKKVLLLSLAQLVCAVSFATAVVGLPWERLSVSIDANPRSIEPGQSAMLTWSSSRASAVSLDGETVATSGTREVSPSETTTYTITAQGRRRSVSDSVTVRVVDPSPQPEPQPDPDPTPTPKPTPIDGSTLSAVGVWEAIGAESKLAMAAHSHDVAELLRAQNGGWLVIDPIMAEAVNCPGWVNKWLDVLEKSGKTHPAVIWHDQGKILAIDQLAVETTAEALLELAKSRIPVSPDGVVIHGRHRPTGLKPRTEKPGRVLLSDGSTIPQISATLKPLSETEYPTVDLRTRITRIKNQGRYGTCSSQSACTAMESLRYAQFGPENDVELSPNNLASQIGGWNGASLSATMQALVKNGVLPMADQPNYTSRMPSNWRHKAAGYRLLAVYDSPDSDLMGYLAAALARGWVVQIGVGVGGGFDADSDGLISYARGSGRGGHAVTACGLKKHDGRWWILIANSWGKSWGQDGFAWIESKFLTNSIYSDMWVAVVAAASPDDKACVPNSKEKQSAPPPSSCPSGTCPTNDGGRRGLFGRGG